MHSRIYLVGFMGSGKTTHGKKIARMMGYEFIDLDQWIVKKEGLSVKDIFGKFGESYFREKETEAIMELATREKVVISTGGGVPCHNNNMDLLNKYGLTIYLKLSKEALYSRLAASKTKRPLLEGLSPDEMKAKIDSMLNEREPYYSLAAMIVDGLESVDERLVNAIQRKK